MPTNKTRIGTLNPRSRQTGATLIALVTLVVIASASLLLNELRSGAQLEAENHIHNAKALATAKAALIAYAVTYPDNYGATDPDAGPGFLPCPDTTDPTLSTAGSPDPACGVTDVGRLPDHIFASGLTLGDVRDAAGERLWYAVHRNFRYNPKIHDIAPYDPLNSETVAGITLDGMSDVVAVIISPGPPLEDGVIDQSGRKIDPLDIDNYLEGDNATTGDDSFASAATGAFNDRVVAITRAELMRVVEKRVLAEVASVLGTYRDSFGVDVDFDGDPDTYPWLSPFAKPNEAVLIGIADVGSRGTTLVDTDLTVDFVELGVRAGDTIHVNRMGNDDPLGVIAIDGVTSNTLTVSRLLGGANNNFQDGDDYRISRFNSHVGETEGLLPFHEPSGDPSTMTVPNEPFKTEMVIDWNLQSGALSGVDNGINVTLPVGVLATYESAMERFVESSVTSGAVPVAINDGVCTWAADAKDGVHCVGTFSMTYFSGLATNGADDELEDASLHFDEWGVGPGALVENLSDVGFGGDPAWAIVKNVADNKLEFTANLQDGVKNQFDPADQYRVRVPTRSTPTAPYDTAEFLNGTSTLADSGVDFAAIGVEVGDVIHVIHNDFTSQWGKITGFHPSLSYVVHTTGVDFSIGGSYAIYYDYVENREYEFEFDYAGDASAAHAIQGTKRRDVCSNGGPNEETNYDWPNEQISLRPCTVSGTASAGSNADVLADINLNHSGVATFAGLGVSPGDVIDNTTDGSRGLILSPVSGNTLTVASLTGGRLNRWTVGDSYLIRLIENLDDENLVSNNLKGDPYSLDGINDDLAKVTIRDTDSRRSTVGVATAEVPATSSPTDKAMGFVDVQDRIYDLEPTIDLPEWFTVQGWHRLSYVAVSSAFVPGPPTGNCTPGTDCLIVTGTTPDDDKDVVIIAAGDVLSGQDRSTVASTCGPVEPGFFCDYFEGENADFDFDDTFPAPPPEFEHSPISHSFNDQVRIVEQ